MFSSYYIYIKQIPQQYNVLCNAWNCFTISLWSPSGGKPRESVTAIFHPPWSNQILMKISFLYNGRICNLEHLPPITHGNGLMQRNINFSKTCLQFLVNCINKLCDKLSMLNGNNFIFCQKISRSSQSNFNQF